MSEHVNTPQQPMALSLADKYEVQGFLGDHRFAKDEWCRQAAVELLRQHARIEQLEKYESDLISERDYRDEIIDRMADAVLGTDRAVWSSSYELADAAQEVEDFMVQVGATNAKVEKLEAEVEKLQQQLIAEAKKTAEEKLRADQLDKQHTMQSRMHAEVNQKLVEAARQDLKEYL